MHPIFVSGVVLVDFGYDSWKRIKPHCVTQALDLFFRNTSRPKHFTLSLGQCPSILYLVIFDRVSFNRKQERGGDELKRMYLEFGKFHCTVNV